MARAINIWKRKLEPLKFRFCNTVTPANWGFKQEKYDSYNRFSNGI